MFARYALYNLSVKQIEPAFFRYTQCMHFRRSNDNLISTLEHSNTILNVFNYRSTNYLTRFKLPISQANALLLHKEKHGSFKSLQDVLKVEGMTESILNEFLRCFVKDELYHKSLKTRRSIFLPKINSISPKTVSTVLGIYIGVNVVTWTLLGVNENVLEWNYKSFSQIPLNNSTLDLLEMVSQLNNKLPTADFYVVDEMNYGRQVRNTLRHLKPLLQQQHLKAMLLAFLKNRSIDAENRSMKNLYLAEHDKIANLYGLRIGNEITSSAKVVYKLLHKEVNARERNENSIGVYIPKDVMSIYEKQLDFIRDQMNWSLLTALTFLQLSVHGKFYCDFA